MVCTPPLKLKKGTICFPLSFALMTLKVINRSSRALHRHRNKLILYLYVNYCKVSTGAFSSTRKLGLS